MRHPLRPINSSERCFSFFSGESVPQSRWDGYPIPQTLGRARQLGETSRRRVFLERQISRRHQPPQFLEPVEDDGARVPAATNDRTSTGLLQGLVPSLTRAAGVEGSRGRDRAPTGEDRRHKRRRRPFRPTPRRLPRDSVPVSPPSRQSVCHPSRAFLRPGFRCSHGPFEAHGRKEPCGSLRFMRRRSVASADAIPTDQVACRSGARSWDCFGGSHPFRSANLRSECLRPCASKVVGRRPLLRRGKSSNPQCRTTGGRSATRPEQNPWT